MHVCIYVCLSHAQTICFYSLALCPHCWSLHFKFCHNIFNLLSTVRHAVGIKPAICNTQSLSQDTSNPRSCGGGVVPTEGTRRGLQRGSCREVVCNDQIVQRHAGFDDDGSSRNCQLDGPLQYGPLVHQHAERAFNCHSQRTVIEGENTFVRVQIANVGS